MCATMAIYMIFLTEVSKGIVFTSQNESNVQHFLIITIT